MIQNFSTEIELKKMDQYYLNSDLSHVYSKHRKQIILLLHTIESLWETKELDNKTYEILFDGLKNSWSVVFFHVVGEALDSMYGKIDGIEKVIIDGINDKSWRVRFNSLVIMKTFSHKKLKNEIIELGLNDKSKKVREMAIDIKKYYSD